MISNRPFILCLENEIQFGQFTIRPSFYPDKITYCSIGDDLIVCSFYVCDIWDTSRTFLEPINPEGREPQPHPKPSPPQLVKSIVLAGPCKYARMEYPPQPRAQSLNIAIGTLLYQTEDDQCLSVKLTNTSRHRAFGPMKICSPYGLVDGEHGDKVWKYRAEEDRFVVADLQIDASPEQFSYSNVLYNDREIEVVGSMGTTRYPIEEGSTIDQAGHGIDYHYAISNTGMLCVHHINELGDRTLHETDYSSYGHIKEKVATQRGNQWCFLPVTDEGYVLHNAEFMSPDFKSLEETYKRIEDVESVNITAYSSLDGPDFVGDRFGHEVF